MKKNLLLTVFAFAFSFLKAQSPPCNASFNYTSSGLSAFFVDSSYGNISSAVWTWNFGDGETSTQQSPVHTYAAAGTYVVCLNVFTPFTNCQNTYCDSVTVGITNTCSASFLYNVDTANGLLINFFDASTVSATQAWDFGDGNVDSTQNPTHTYTYAGTYNVCLTITDSTGCTNTFCQGVLAGNDGCSAHMTYVHDTSAAFMFHFNNDSQGSTTNTGWLWTFGDGDTAYTQNASHTFTAAGFFPVCLTMYDSVLNCTNTYCEYIEVSECYAYYTAVADTVNPRIITFTDHSFGTPTGWLWSFEDGTTSTEQNPVHTYAFDAWRRVCLTVTDSVNDCTSQFCELVYAGSPSSCYEYWELAPDTADALTIHFFEYSWGTVPTNFHWDFGDGDTSDLRNPVHTYDEAGVYFVCCNISDSAGTCDYSDCYYLTVGQPSTCHAEFAYTTISGGLVSFVDSSSGSSATSYLWDFGNWGTSSQLNPYNNFQAPGDYYVCLTITDSASCHSTYCDTITVMTTGTDEFAMTNNFVVYPNPAKDNLYVQNLSQSIGAKGWVVKIYNTVGELVEQRVVNATTATFDFSDKPSGVYFVSLQDEQTIAQKRVIITK